MLTRLEFIALAAKAALATPKHLRLQPFVPYDESALPVMARSLEEVFGYAVDIAVPFPLPEEDRDPRRGRYRAVILTERLASLSETVLGVTSADICKNRPGIPDWGIIGTAMLGGPAAIISTHRLRRAEWLPIVTVHEVGHLQGYTHCDNPRCQMLDIHGDASKYDGMRYGWFCNQHYSTTATQDPL